VKHTKLALLKLKRLIDTKGLKAHFPVEIRFVKGDDIWLSPAYGEEERCFIGLIAYRPYGKDTPYETLFREAQAILEELGGRPHWGKIHYWTFRECAKAYPKWADFLALRERLDPRRLFWNNYMERVFEEHPKR
jgi:L-gulonolactone oxidase